LCQEWGKWEIKKITEGDEFNYDIRTLVNVTMYPSTTVIKKKIKKEAICQYP
jgi:hypothetical protein